MMNLEKMKQKKSKNSVEKRIACGNNDSLLDIAYVADTECVSGREYSTRNYD